jgi:ABC-type transporter Mla subunit MlaD
LKDIADSYQAKADELKKASPSLDAANATFTKGVDELGKVFESVKLFKPDLGKGVN